MAASGIDLHKILSQQDPESAAVIRPSDPTRIVRALEVLSLTGQGISAHQKRHALSDRPFEVLTLIVDRPSQEMDGRLKLRTKAMFEKGLLDELKGLLALGYPAEAKPFQSVGYRECLAVLEGTIDLERAIELTFLRTRQLAKRQRTWFRGQTPEATWLYPDLAAALKLAQGFLKVSP
jgi:tRNA dimethylallyltransferase